MRKWFFSGLVILGLGGCASNPMMPPSPTGAAATAEARSQAAARAAQEAQQKLAATAVQRRAAEGQFCASWRRALDLARRDAIGCARMEADQQAACWSAVAEWAGEESRYFSALESLFAEGPYATSAGKAGEFFHLTQSWATTCGDSLADCTSAPQRATMDQRKVEVNRFCH